MMAVSPLGNIDRRAKRQIQWPRSLNAQPKDVHQRGVPARNELRLRKREGWVTCDMTCTRGRPRSAR